LKKARSTIPKPQRIFGLHGSPILRRDPVRPGGTMASADAFRIVVQWRQTMARSPGGHPIDRSVASQIVLGLQTIASRQVDVTAAPAIVTVGAINGGVRFNIIPDRRGDARDDPHIRTAVRNDITHACAGRRNRIAQSAGATAQVVIDTIETAVTYNDTALTERDPSHATRGGGGKPASRSRRSLPGGPRRILTLSAAHSGRVLFPRHHAAGDRPRQSGAESLAQVLCR